MMYEWESELLALSALDDQKAADAINAMTVEVTLVPRWKIKSYLYESGAWGMMRIAVQKVEEPNLRGLLLTVFDYLSDPDFENLDLGLSSVALIFDALQAAGLITQNDRNAINSMKVTRPKYTKIGPHHVAAARGGT